MSTTNERTLRSASAHGASAVQALTERGVLRPEELLGVNTPIAILAWCRWWDRQRDVGKELLVERIRSGAPPPQGRVDDQRAYAEEIRSWLKRKLPDVCSPEPHYAAVAAVIRLHSRYGKGALTARTHGAVIRAAVSAAERRAGEG